LNDPFRPRARLRHTVLLLGAALAASAPTSALADSATKARCVDANSRAQELRREGKLSLAREQLVACAVPACPDIVRRDCTKRLDDLESVQPTVVFEVTDATGSRLPAARVSVDGRPVATALGGSPIALDPGTHSVTFEVTGSPAVTRSIVLLEGDKGHRESVVLGAAPPAQPAVTAPAPAAATPPAPAPSGLGGQRTAGLVVGGVGVAGMVVGGVFGGLAFSEKSSETSACGASCSSAANPAQAKSARSAGVTDSTVSTVGLAAGGGLLVAGAVLFFTGHRGNEASPATAGWTVAPQVGRDGLPGLSFEGSF
jgi:hypothetical protein